MTYTYVLLGTTKTGEQKFYVGYTTDLKERMKKHVSGATVTTRRFEHIKLVYYEACLSDKDARVREKQLKTGFGRGYINKRLSDYLAGMV